MGTITINVDNEIEIEFRDTVKKTYGQGKGILGKAVEEALKKWTYENNQKEIGRRLKTMMEKGWPMGKILYKHREELHDRSL